MARASLNHCFHYLNEHGHGSRGGSFDASRDRHVDQGGFAFARIPRPYGLYRSEADFGNCAKKGILSPV